MKAQDQKKDYFELLFMESHFSRLQNTFRRTANVKWAKYAHFLLYLKGLGTSMSPSVPNVKFKYNLTWPDLCSVFRVQIKLIQFLF